MSDFAKDANVPTNDCVSRQAAIDAIMKKPAWHGSDGSYYHSSDIRQALEFLPSAQPEIIHCKDCKHWDGVDTCDVIDAPVWDNDFCSMAERRSNE